MSIELHSLICLIVGALAGAGLVKLWPAGPENERARLEIETAALGLFAAMCLMLMVLLFEGGR